jgi:hypothetical protein
MRPSPTTRTGKGRYTLVGLVAGLALAVPAQAGATVTIGGNLSSGATSTQSCVPPGRGCVTTLTQELIGSDDQASPISGVIVRWRVRDASGSLRLRVLRKELSGQWTGVRTGDTATAGSSGILGFGARLPIAAGQYVGVDLLGATSLGARNGTGAQHNFVGGGLPDGDTSFPSSTGPGEYLFNATIEPDTDDDGFGDETQDDCPGSVGPRNGCETTPPETMITKAPKRKINTRTRKKRVRFEFVSSEPGSDFRCVVDDEPPVACDSPFKERFRRGKHRFEVQAIDQADNADPTPAFAKFKLKRTKRRH